MKNMDYQQYVTLLSDSYEILGYKPTIPGSMEEYINIIITI